MGLRAFVWLIDWFCGFWFCCFIIYYISSPCENCFNGSPLNGNSCFLGSPNICFTELLVKCESNINNDMFVLNENNRESLVYNTFD